MPSGDSEISHFEVRPLTPERWIDLEKLFGQRGACGGCWCMWWRLPRSKFLQQRGEANKNAFRNIVDSGEAPGILGYSKDQPIGWCAVAPRQTFPTLTRSRILKRVDDEPVWSVVCFFVAKAFRRKGISSKLLRAALDYVGKKGGKKVEGYPVEPPKKSQDTRFLRLYRLSCSFSQGRIRGGTTTFRNSSNNEIYN